MLGHITFFANVICLALVFASSSLFRIAENKTMSSQVESHFPSHCSMKRPFSFCLLCRCPIQFQPFLNDSSSKRQQYLAVPAFSGKKPSIVNSNIQQACKNWKVPFFPSSVVLVIHVNDFGNVGRPLPHKIKNTSTGKRHFSAQAIFSCEWSVRASVW